MGRPRTVFGDCSINGCGLPAKSRGWCKKHYQLWWKNGDPLIKLQATPLAFGSVCCVDECNRPHRTHGYCGGHWWKMKQYGDPHGGIGRWPGDHESYYAVHRRLCRARGKASVYACDQCGNRAAHWSYDHAAAHERFDPKNGPFSGDIAHYRAMCVPCHKKFDLARSKA